MYQIISSQMSFKNQLLKDLVKRTQSDKVLKDKAFKNASDPKCDGYQRGLAPMVQKFLTKGPLCVINLVEVASLMNQIIN